MPSASAGEYSPLATLHTTTGSSTDETQSECPHPRTQQTTRSTRERIGTVSFLMVSLGSGLLLLPWALLGLLWRESMTATSGGAPNTFWTWIVHANWMARLVTVCTALARTIVTLQASLMTAMVSSIILETIGTRLLHAPFYSLIRALSVSPTTLLLNKGTLAQPKRPLSLLVSALVVVEVLVTVASQFLSTILISDFADSSFVEPKNVSQVGIFSRRGAAGTPWWRVPQASSWTFGELAGSFSHGEGFHDTGHTYRAFLPFIDEARRTSLQSFHGPAEVMDQRVVCVSPSFVDLRLNSTFPLRLFGQMTLQNASSYPMLHNMQTQRPINFTCALPYPSENTTYGMSSLCYPRLGRALTIQLEDPLVKVNADDRIANQTGVASNNPLAASLLIVLDIMNREAMMARNRKNITTPFTVTTTRNDGPWSMIMNDANTAALRVSACFTNLVSKTMTVDMAARSPQSSEPRLSWDRNSNSFNTESVRRQLGASLTPDPLHHRGVLALNPKSEWQDFDMRIDAIKDDFRAYHAYFHYAATFLGLLPPAQQALAPPDLPPANMGILLAPANTADTSTADQSHTDVFKDVVRDTNSPALALQALITRGTQAAYYENLMREDQTASASTAFASTALMPVRWGGFVAGVAIIAVHFVVLAATVVLFVKYTWHSMMGNCWQAVAQLVSEDMLLILEQACGETDEEVKKRWRKDHLQGLGTVRSWPDGRVAVGVEAKERLG